MYVDYDGNYTWSGNSRSGYEVRVAGGHVTAEQCCICRDVALRSEV